MGLRERFDIVLLDMNGTFMFGGDRLAEGGGFRRDVPEHRRVGADAPAGRDDHPGLLREDGG
jgi:hypothetical protein